MTFTHTLSTDEQNMRDASHEYLASNIYMDAKDMSLEVVTLSVEQKKSICKDLADARDLLNAAIAECIK